MKKILASLIFVTLSACCSYAATKPISIQVGQHSFILPFQKVTATQLYSFRDGKGFPGLETVLYSYQKFQVTFGAAAVLGESKDVPFAGAQFTLPSALFDTGNNSLLFGVYAGKETGKKGLTVGIKASTPLW